MAEGSSPDVDEKLFLGSLRASRAINKVNFYLQCTVGLEEYWGRFSEELCPSGAFVFKGAIVALKLLSGIISPIFHR